MDSLTRLIDITYTL